MYKSMITNMMMATLCCRLPRFVSRGSIPVFGRWTPHFGTSQHESAAEKVDISREERNKLLELRFAYPDMLPDPQMNRRHFVREKLERSDMLRRRTVVEIPEFYVGSIMAVVVSDPFAPGKANRFVGICIQRGGHSLRSFMVLRNVVDKQGVEIMYEIYNPTIQKIEVLRLEKRLDDELFYLRDAPQEYSTFPFDMQPEVLPEGSAIPVNPIKVKLKPMPWHEQWERKNLKGVEDLELPQKYYDLARKYEQPWEKYDLMKEYRRLIPEEEQLKIFKEVGEHIQATESQKGKQRRKVFQKPVKTA